MQLDEFNRINSLVGAINGGVTRIDRALLNIGSLAKNQAADSVQKIMAARIDKALAHLSSSPTTAQSDNLRTNQSLLIGKKAGINEAIDIAERDGWNGIVIENNDKQFSVGANLMNMGMMAMQKNFDAIEEFLVGFQEILMRMRT